MPINKTQREVGCAKIMNIFFSPKKGRCLAFIDVRVADRPGLLLDLLKVISEERKYNIVTLNSYIGANGSEEGNEYCVRLAVESTREYPRRMSCKEAMSAELSQLELRLRSIENVKKVRIDIQERNKLVIDDAFPVVFKFGPIMTESVIFRKQGIKNLFRKQLDLLGKELGEAVIFSMGFHYGEEVGRSYLFLKKIFEAIPDIAEAPTPEEKRRRLLYEMMKAALRSYQALGLGYPDIDTFEADFETRTFSVMTYDNVDVASCLFSRGIYAGVVTEFFRNIYGEIDPAFQRITFTAIAERSEEVDISKSELPVRFTYSDRRLVNCKIVVKEHTEEMLF